MADLLFSFQETLDELQSMAKIARQFLTAESQEIVIPECIALLESIRTGRRDASHVWTISDDRPLRTVDSAGEYEPANRQGQHTVFGELSFVWEIRCPHEAGPRRQLQKKFLLGGKSSSRIRIKTRVDDQVRELAMWRFEIGDDAAPGCHFHAQIEGERLEPPFPHSLSVPRLPSILVTPMAAFEFLLSELFQQRWQRHAAEETADMQRWKPIQRNRFIKLFEWQSEYLLGCSGSPWSALKAHKPPADLFEKAQ